jgi:hypothetical protein
MRRRSSLATLFALTLGFPLDAQIASRPAPEADRIHCALDSLEIFVIRQGARQRTGTVVDDCRVTGESTARVLTRVYRTTDAVLGNRLDTIVDAWSTLQPRSYHSIASSEVVNLVWAGGRLRGRVQAPGKPTTSIDEDIEPTVFNGASFDMLLRASPLAMNYSVTVPAYVPSSGVVTLTAKVVGEEVIDGQATWRIDADFTGMSVSFWIGKTSRRLLKQLIHVAPGADIEFVASPARRS